MIELVNYLMESITMSDNYLQPSLQIFSILYGLDGTTIQKIIMVASFVQIARCSIQQDIETELASDIDAWDNWKNFTFRESIIATFKRLHFYISTIIFRIIRGLLFHLLSNTMIEMIAMGYVDGLKMEPSNPVQNLQFLNESK